jgi:hypothetical protein
MKLHKVQQVPRDYFYYSFLVSLESDARLWKYDDVRICAKDYKHALRLYRVLCYDNPKLSKITFDFSSSPVYVRKVIEFQIKRYKHSQWHFKYIRSITPTF